MAAPVWQVRTTAPGTTAASIVIAIPGAPLTANDIVLVTVYKENTAAVTPHAGYAHKTGSGVPPTTTAPQGQYTFWYRATGGETGNLTFSWTGSTFTAATAHRFTGCITTGDPIQDIIGAFSNASVATLNVSLASGTGDTLLYLAQTNFAGGNSYTSPGGFTERSDIDVIGDTTKANPGALASGAVSQSALVSGAMTSVLLSLVGDTGAASDAGLWAPANTGIILPQSPLYFPFVTPWADFTSTGVSGTAAPTEAADTAAATGQLGYSGTSTATEAADTSTATGTVVNPVTGTSAASQANQTASASGQLGYSGTGTPTQAAQTSSATGQLGYTGTAATSQAAQSSSASGTFTSAGSFSGSAAVTQANQTASASGQLGYSGTAARTQANNTAAASGTVVNPVTGTASPSQAGQFSIASGILRYSGTSTASQAANTASGSGLVSGPVIGTAAVVQANQTAIAVGTFAALVSFGTAHAATGAVPGATAAELTTATASSATASTPTASAASGSAATSSAGSMTVPTATGG